ncbi:MAG: hypothetical protein J2P48_15050 [Alphaproteobacteria bacterium]|nr:hypothetical protein [Alphaproteobacteria bacterium]
MRSRLAFEIAATCVDELPRVRPWVGECLCADGTSFTVTLLSYGEAALSVVRVPDPVGTGEGG